MRILASFACSGFALLGGCILVYDPGSFEIGGGGDDGRGSAGGGGTGGSSGANGGGATGGVGGANGGGGAGGGNGGGPVCSPQDPIDGVPVAASPEVWTWISVPEAKCRSGSSTGFGIRLNPNSSKLFIFFEGKGACFNELSCADTPSLFGSTEFEALKNLGVNNGIFDMGNPANPLHGWNAVFIPYCTGDSHAGSNTSLVDGTQLPSQYFFGFTNVGHYMTRIVPTFPNVTEVLVTGISTGGGGALYNYDRIARDFCGVPVVLISDSGLLMSDDYMAPCLQAYWRKFWGMNSTLPKDCPEAIGPGGGLVNLNTCLGKKYQGAHLGIIASNHDNEIATFLGFGQNNCMKFNEPPIPLPSQTYEEGLLQLRDTYMDQSPAWRTYFVNSTTHTYLADKSFYDIVVNSTSLKDWVDDMVNDGPITPIGP